ncbi:acyl-CoA thioesterase [Streptomyces fuscichromogenes]|uniref:Acyl-CoA thioesterase II n=1 Tax=Streptomyces fuscichromogenes TaxID=1324013 RepID=A0A918CNW2_9ACTN|nr:acyl-CoA thioesterase II [Streptomyces fuscichromogenes]GGM98332.1 acyl-CoA thioesterase II [Streptomyces fuscichromogenes]
MPRLHDVLALQRLTDDVFRSPAMPTLLKHTFGGQLVGQALAAALRTAPRSLVPHSLHGYFLQPGLPRRPTELHVERLHDGRSFATRHVTTRQDERQVFSLSVSFQRTEPGPDAQETMPSVPDPDDVDAFSPPPPVLARLLREEWPDWELRMVPRRRTADGTPQARGQYWMRHREPLADVPALHICGLAYLSDLTLLGTAALPHPSPPVMAASLDHCLWLLRPFRVDEWLLYDQISPSSGNGRGLAQGRFFDRTGRLVAMVAQEGLLRWPPR